ncbi:ADP-ribosylation factor-like protein 2 [Intoshia linei]|uniref:ADP-ribosylation factor-like protein 2 n=1 Tax=Intoshia linei TaxID=1819745 RepID=A0A177B5I7_9BILA|nr:ADP-ribosylation factor-like protein 2 [Intoshia linei]
MGLNTILKKLKRKSQEMRILILGLDNAGKSTFVNNILNEDVTKIVPTVGFQIKSVVHNDYTINIWDVGGQLSLRTFWRNYFESTDGLIWVVDSSDRDRMIDCAKELHKLLKEEPLIGAPLLVLANKRDLVGSLDSNSISEYLQLEKLKNRRWQIFQVSSMPDCKKPGLTNTITALDWLIQRAVEVNL